MPTYKHLYGPDVIKRMLSYAKERGVKKLPTELLRPHGNGVVLGPISAQSRKLALNLYAYSVMLQVERRKAIGKGDDAIRAFQIAYESAGIYLIQAFNKILAVQLSCDVAMDFEDIGRKFEALAIGEGEVVLGFPLQKRQSGSLLENFGEEGSLLWNDPRNPKTQH